MFSYKKNNVLVNSFENISSLYKFINETPRRENARIESEENDEYFSGTSSLDEAYNLLLGGDEKLFEKFKSLDKISIDKLLGNVINRPKEINDIVGFQANVPQYLLGIPTNMINQEPKRVSQKVLNIILNIAVSCGVDKDEIQKVGNLYIQVLDLLEKAEYRVNLYVMQASESCSNYYYSLVRIKTDREPFNIKKCIFPIMHPSMHRRIFFKWEESCDALNEITRDGYGRPHTDNKKIKEKLDKILKANFIVWNFQRWKNGNSIDVETQSILKELKDNYGIEIK